MAFTRHLCLWRLGPVWLGLAAVLPVARADLVIEWNAAMTHYNESQPPPGAPPPELRAYALAHTAMFHAIEHAGNSRGHAGAAGAQAAHDVLTRLLPGGAADFKTLLDRQLAAIPDGPDKLLGRNHGAEAARRQLSTRADDGIADAEGPYQPGTRPGDYQFTPPFAGYAHFPKLGRARPFVLKDAGQFRAPAPYAVTDPAYAFDFNEIKVLGARHSTVRSADQTDLARFWFEMSAFGWNRLARILAARQPDTLLERARLFAVLNTAMADTIVASFESKYHYRFWRPVTAIHAAETDGNPHTAPDPAWEPLLTTPPIPDYPSTHAALGGAAETVLIWFFHGDEHTFTLPTTMVKEFPALQPRTFHRISDAAVENALSRLFVGIHFRAACLAGLQQGRDVGAWILQHAPMAGPR
jgi:hypothetical protein